MVLTWSALGNAASVLTIIQAGAGAGAKLYGHSRLQRFEIVQQRQNAIIQAHVKDSQHRHHQILEALHSLGANVFATGKSPGKHEASGLLPIEAELTKRGETIIRDRPVIFAGRSYRNFRNDPEQYIDYVQRADRPPKNPHVLGNPTYVAFSFERNGEHLIGFGKVGMLELLGVSYQPLLTRYGIIDPRELHKGLRSRLRFDLSWFRRSDDVQYHPTSIPATHVAPAPRKPLPSFPRKPLPASPRNEPDEHPPFSYVPDWRSVEPMSHTIPGKSEKIAHSGQRTDGGSPDPWTFEYARQRGYSEADILATFNRFGMIPPCPIDVKCWASGKFRKSDIRTDSRPETPTGKPSGDSVPWAVMTGEGALRFDNMRRIEAARAAPGPAP